MVADFHTVLSESVIYVYDHHSTDDTVLQAQYAGAQIGYERFKVKSCIFLMGGLILNSVRKDRWEQKYLA